MLKPSEKLEGLNGDFLQTLKTLATKLPFDVVITEGFTQPKPGSAHVKASEHFEGLGVDCSAPNGWTRYMLVTTALACGIKRIGVYDKHVHLGGSTKLPSPVMWGGLSH